MDSVFPLVKKYGGVVVALTLDDNGIPDTAEERLQIAEKIILEAGRYGIDKKDIIFDPLAMAISAGGDAAKVTLRSLDMISRKLGAHTSLGISNISFGLPRRDAINSTFFLMALEKGLSAAIMNPYSEDMMKVFYAYKAIKGIDENFTDYIAAAEEFAEAGAQSAVNNDALSADAAGLKAAIIKGLKEKAAKETGELLRTVPPLDIVNNEIIPALEAVGGGFENKTIYLPGLLMSAEAAKSAFEVIKTSMAASGKSSNGDTFVLATVKGDIHDIGKNIVKLLLENYGFNVVDLGKDVPPETVVAKTVELHAPLVGLSALMTTTLPAMEETINLLKSAAPWCKTVVGGAVLTKEYADKIGADKYAKDAMETVRFAQEIKAQGGK